MPLGSVQPEMARMARRPRRFVSARVRNGEGGGRKADEDEEEGEIRARAWACVRARQRDVIGCDSTTEQKKSHELIIFIS